MAKARSLANAEKCKRPYTVPNLLFEFLKIPNGGAVAYKLEWTST